MLFPGLHRAVRNISGILEKHKTKNRLSRKNAAAMANGCKPPHVGGGRIRGRGGARARCAAAGEYREGCDQQQLVNMAARIHAARRLAQSTIPFAILSMFAAVNALVR